MSFLVARFGALLTMDLRRIVYRQMLYLDLAQHAKTNTGQLMSRLVQDVSSITGAITMLFGKTLREPLKLTVCLIGAAFISWRLLIFSLVLAPLALLLMTRLASSIKRASRRCMDQMGRMYSRISESLDGRLVFTEHHVGRAFVIECFRLLLVARRNLLQLNDGFLVLLGLEQGDAGLQQSRSSLLCLPVARRTFVEPKHCHGDQYDGHSHRDETRVILHAGCSRKPVPPDSGANPEMMAQYDARG